MVEVLKTGIFDTIQDFGRTDVQQFGVPYSGVMDQYSATLANTILGNAPYVALIESTLKGPTLKFKSPTELCITGANANPKLNDKAIKINMAIAVKAGDVLSFGKIDYGCRIYIAVSGGFQTEFSLHSRSMYPAITNHHRIHKGDLLPISECTRTNLDPHSAVKPAKEYFESPYVDAFKGPEFEWFNAELQSKLIHSEFTVASSSNRMAYQIEERLPNTLKSMISSMVLPGTVQLTPSGQLIILMRDCQTTGGYPRVLQLSEAAINRMAQKNFGSKFQFRLSN